MYKNYYKILEVDKDASSEIIKKAYTTLAKKYHPDLQDSNQKHIYEEKMQLINEAYEILSNDEKRKQFDIILEQDALKNEKITTDLFNENLTLKDELNRIKHNTTNNQPESSTNINIENQIRYQQELNQAREKAYHDAYIQDLKNRGYKIIYKKTLKDYLKNFMILLITIAILFLLWQLPFVKNFFINVYEENSIIKTFVDIIFSLFK